LSAHNPRRPSIMLLMQTPLVPLPKPQEAPASLDHLPFPQKLMHVIDRTPLLEWSRDGRAFCIHNVGDFEKIVLKEYFGGTKYASFTRKLNRWGFRRVAPTFPFGEDDVVFFHAHFQRHGWNQVVQIQGNNSSKKQQRGRALLVASTAKAAAPSPMAPTTTTIDTAAILQRRRQLDTVQQEIAQRTALMQQQLLLLQQQQQQPPPQPQVDPGSLLLLQRQLRLQKTQNEQEILRRLGRNGGGGGGGI